MDRLADEVELQRLCTVGVLSLAGEEAQKRTGSRLVATEYAFLEKRADTYSPATSTHILNLLPLMYLQKLGESDPEIKVDSMEVTLACLDVKDAFLMVPQDKPVKIKVGQEEFLVERNWPGQRVGAKNWYCNVSFALGSQA